MRTGQLEFNIASDIMGEAYAGYVRDVTIWIEQLVDGTTFSAETIRDVIGDPPGHGDVLGTIIRNAHKAKLIQRYGSVASTRADAHGRWISMWSRR